MIPSGISWNGRKVCFGKGHNGVGEKSRVDPVDLEPHTIPRSCRCSFRYGGVSDKNVAVLFDPHKNENDSFAYISFQIIFGPRLRVAKRAGQCFSCSGINWTDADARAASHVSIAGLICLWLLIPPLLSSISAVLDLHSKDSPTYHRPGWAQ